MYNDDYPTCASTYVTLRIYPGDADADSVTARLGLQPTKYLRKGEPHRPDRPGSAPAHLNGWFLSSRAFVDSKDSRRHLDWLFQQLIGRDTALQALQAEGCRMDISCYWYSESGHGGPTLSPSQSRQLAARNLELWFDVYVFSEDETNDQPEHLAQVADPAD